MKRQPITHSLQLKLLPLDLALTQVPADTKRELALALAELLLNAASNTVMAETKARGGEDESEANL